LLLGERSKITLSLPLSGKEKCSLPFSLLVKEITLPLSGKKKASLPLSFWAEKFTLPLSCLARGKVTPSLSLSNNM
jgi:hypothetical protein